MFKKAFSHPPNPTCAETHAFPWQGRSERGPVTRCILKSNGYPRNVEGLSEAIDPLQQREQRVPRLEAFFNILLSGVLVMSGAGVALRHDFVLSRTVDQPICAWILESKEYPVLLRKERSLLEGGMTRSSNS